MRPALSRKLGVISFVHTEVDDGACQWPPSVLLTRSSNRKLLTVKKCHFHATKRHAETSKFIPSTSCCRHANQWPTNRDLPECATRAGDAPPDYLGRILSGETQKCPHSQSRRPGRPAVSRTTQHPSRSAPRHPARDATPNRIPRSPSRMNPRNRSTCGRRKSSRTPTGYSRMEQRIRRSRLNAPRASSFGCGSSSRTPRHRRWDRNRRPNPLRHRRGANPRPRRQERCQSPGRPA